MKSLFISLLSIFIYFTASAQSDLLLYNFNAIPQSLHTNPAYEQQTRLWIGLPGISGVQVHYHNNGFALIDLLEKGTDVNANKDRIILGLDEKSQICLNQSTELLGVGFRAWKGFVTIGATEQIDFRMGFPADLMRLINAGNGIPENRNLDIGNFGFEALARTNYYIGYQRKYNDKLRLGGRLKFIIGQAHINTERTEANIRTTDSSSLVITTDALIRTAGIANLVDDTNTHFNFFPGNLGFGVDLGASYDFNDRWNFSASVLDLGFINWSKNTKDFTSKGTYQFDGVDADLSQDRPVESFQNITDTLKKTFNFKESNGNSYNRALSSRFYLAANYHITQRHTVGLLYHGQVWNHRLFNDISVNYQGRLSDAFQLTVGYSIIDRTYSNLGAGFSLKLGPVQLYMLSDNVLNAIRYENLKTSNVRVGINITLYDKKDKSARKTDKKEEDIPENTNFDSTKTL